MPTSITLTGNAGFPNVAEALKQLAAALAKQAADNLVQSGHVASGALAKSIVPGQLKVTGNTMQIDILGLDYAQYIDKGVRGTQGGQGLFAFKSKYPSKAMVTAVTKWMAQKGITAQATQKNTRRHKTSTATVTQAAAYAIARSVLQHGIKPTGFMSAAVATIQQQADELLGNALQADVINALPQNLNDLKK